MQSAQESDLAPLFRNLRQSEKLSQVMPPLQKYSTTDFEQKNLLLVDASPPNSTTEVTLAYSFPSAFNNK